MGFHVISGEGRVSDRSRSSSKRNSKRTCNSSSKSNSDALASDV